MKDNQALLGTESIGKLLIKYSVPAIIGMMVNGLYNVVDRIFIGNIPGVGSMAIAGVGVTMPIMTIILAFSMLIGMGTVTNISIKLGQGKKEEAEKLIGNALTLGIIIGITIMVVGLVFGDQILQLFGASENSLVYAKSYMDIILIGCTANIIAFIFNHTIRGDGNPKLSAMIMVVGCVLNIVLDAVFIFGFNMGIQGAAIATVISQCVTAIWGLSYYLRGKSNLKLKKSAFKLELHLIKIIAAIGVAPFAMQLSASLVQVINNNALRAHGGDMAIGAMATISSISIMIGMPIVGLTQGAQPIIGFNYGAKQYDRAIKTFKICLGIAAAGLVIGWLGIQLFPEMVVKLFNSDEELVRMTVDGLRKYQLMMPVIAMSFVGSTFMQSVGKAKQAMFLSLLRQVIVLIPMVLILPAIFELNGVWFAQPIADFISATVTFLVVRKELQTYKDFNNEVVIEHKNIENTEIETTI